jgi:hypothetical protein
MGLGRVELPTSRLSGGSIRLPSPTFCRQLARDVRHKRLVALKVLHPELARTLGPERFQREIELAARLQHPHILTRETRAETCIGLCRRPPPCVLGAQQAISDSRAYKGGRSRSRRDGRLLMDAYIESRRTESAPAPRPVVSGVTPLLFGRPSAAESP